MSVLQCDHGGTGRTLNWILQPTVYSSKQEMRPCTADKIQRELTTCSATRSRSRWFKRLLSVLHTKAWGTMNVSSNVRKNCSYHVSRTLLSCATVHCTGKMTLTENANSMTMMQFLTRGSATSVPTLILRKSVILKLRSNLVEVLLSLPKNESSSFHVVIIGTPPNREMYEIPHGKMVSGTRCRGVRFSSAICDADGRTRS